MTASPYTNSQMNSEIKSHLKKKEVVDKTQTVMEYWAGSVSQWPSDHWIFPVNSSPAPDRLSDEIFGVKHIFFVPKLLMRESHIGKINHVMDWLSKCIALSKYLHR